MNEFFQQGDRERDLQLPLGPLNDRTKIKLPASQIGFIDFIVSPLWETWGEVIGNPDCDPIRVSCASETGDRRDRTKVDTAPPQTEVYCTDSSPQLQHMHQNRDCWAALKVEEDRINGTASCLFPHVLSCLRACGRGE